ncbi:MAG: mycothiol conjugate amidase Mca [Acidobacteria bacterium]|nr:mycothiol conjugate amidase Mca [Acidobacteriota bacterium]
MTPRILTVHAHPDDEASKGASTIAKYRSLGAEAMLVCCTGGEAGDVLNPALDTEETRANLQAVRRAELEAAGKVIGYNKIEMLGYRDSGMPDSEENAHPDAFANAPLDEAIERLVRLVRQFRPQVIVTYSDDQQGYQHPDHIRVNDISVPAFEIAGDESQFADAGPAWEPSKLYYTTWSRARIQAMHERFLALNLESPYDDRWFSRPSNDEVITTRVEIGEWYSVRSDALRAHATQVDPASPFWFGLPDSEAAIAYPYDDYQLAQSRVETATPEEDLFAGIDVEFTDSSTRGAP